MTSLRDEGRESDCVARVDQNAPSAEGKTADLNHDGLPSRPESIDPVVDSFNLKILPDGSIQFTVQGDKPLGDHLISVMRRIEEREDRANGVAAYGQFADWIRDEHDEAYFGTPAETATYHLVPDLGSVLDQDLHSDDFMHTEKLGESGYSIPSAQLLSLAMGIYYLHTNEQFLGERKTNVVGSFLNGGSVIQTVIEDPPGQLNNTSIHDRDKEFVKVGIKKLS